MPKVVKRPSAKVAPSPPVRARRAGVRKPKAKTKSARPSAKPKIAPSKPVRARNAGVRKSKSASHSWPKEGGARILNVEEVIANQTPLPPGMETGWEFFRRVLRPLREYNEWLIKNGYPEGLGELDPSLQEGGDK